MSATGHTASSYDEGAQLAYPCEGPNGRAYGLTKRELFAAMAMQGICANPATRGPLACNAIDAVEWADALLDALYPVSDDQGVKQP